MFSDLELRERSVFSPNGEDGVIEALFDRIGLTNKYFVELGCGDGRECNTAHLLEQGWTGLMFDYPGASRNRRATIHSHFITAENIRALLAELEAPAAFDLLSIDVDGNDFWIWRAIVTRPRVVVIKYNAALPPDARLAIAYDPNFVWSGDDYFGAGLRALWELGRVRGYELVYCDASGESAFFVAREALPSDYEPRAIETIYRPRRYRELGAGLHAGIGRAMIDPFADGNGAATSADCRGTPSKCD